MAQNEAGESLKNVILVMHSSGILLPPPREAGATDERTEEQRKLWDASSEKIERILPGFLGDVVTDQAGAVTGAGVKEMGGASAHGTPVLA